MLRMGSVNWSMKGPSPAATAPFNTSGGNRYIYTDPNSESSFGEQLQNYLNNVLGATNPENAPNYENLPTEYPVKGELPSVQNRTTEPMFIKE
jgi:hypothetical protein